MVPPLCTARYDRRLVRGETAASVLAEVQLAMEGLRGIAVEYHHPELRCYTGHVTAVDDFHAAWAVPESGEVVRLAQAGLRSVGQGASTFYAPYCTNGSASAAQMGLPTLFYGAGEVEGAHVVNEALPLEQLDAAVRGYRGLMLALTRSERAAA
jgi:succinyl-diaminopimelate desuccinylase